MDSVKNVFLCQWCLSEIVNPVVLPCGESVCEKHTEELRETKWKCVLCHDIHRLASSQRFPQNKALSTMLKMNLTKLDFGPYHTEAKERVEEVEALYTDYMHAISEPSDYVSNFTQKYINLVDLVREEMIKIIDDACFNMKQEINKLKSDCEDNLRKESLSELQNNLDAKIKTWREKLNELVVNETLWKEITKEAKSAQEEIKTKINAFVPPLALKSVTSSVIEDVWAELSHVIVFPDKNRLPAKMLQDKRTETVVVPNVSKIAKSQSWEPINSEQFTIKGFPFTFEVEFHSSDGKIWLGAYLRSHSNHEKKIVELVFRVFVFGKDRVVITHRSLFFCLLKRHNFNHFTIQAFNCEYTRMMQIGSMKLISIDQIMAHPTYDPAEDMVRVEFVIDKKSVEVKDKVATTQQ